MHTSHPASARAYYRAALSCLRFVEARSPTQRRFGPEADALWKGFKGGLTTTDRVELLLRDADAEWPGAFGARSTFGLRAVSEGDAYSAEWSGIEPIEAEKLWKEARDGQAPSDIDAAIQSVAAAWTLELVPCEVGKISATTRVLATGASAIAALIGEFAGSSSLNWDTQVTVLSDRPGERQLAALAAALLNTKTGTALLSTEDATDGLRFDHLVTSDDADPAARAPAQTLVG